MSTRFTWFRRHYEVTFYGLEPSVLSRSELVSAKPTGSVARFLTPLEPARFRLYFHDASCRFVLAPRQENQALRPTADAFVHSAPCHQQVKHAGCSSANGRWASVTVAPRRAFGVSSKIGQTYIPRSVTTRP